MASIKQWTGLLTNADPHDLTPGAATVQDNCYGRRLGTLMPRQGIRPVATEGGTSYMEPICSMFTIQTPGGTMIFAQTTQGKVLLKKRPL